MFHTFGTIDRNRIQRENYTKDHHNAFLEKYGTMIVGVDLERVGVYATILTPLVDLLRKLAIALAICFYTDYPTFVIFVVNFSSLVHLMFVLFFVPFASATE